MILSGSKKSGDGGERSSGGSGNAGKRAPAPTSEPADDLGGFAGNSNDDDIPFVRVERRWDRA